jgi:hypothetical protein
MIGSGNQIVKLYNNGRIYIKLSSKYIPKANNLVIDTNIKNLGTIFFDKQSFISFRYNKILYELYFNAGKRDMEMLIKINEIFKKYSKKLIEGYYEYLNYPQEINEHHYGDLILFKMSYLKKFKKGHRYYVVNGDYTGNHNIYVFEYNRDGDEDEENYGIMHYANGKQGDALFNPDDIYADIRSGRLYLVKKWRKGFVPPKSLPKAKLFS